MSLYGDAIRALRQVILLDERVRNTATDLTRISQELADLRDRVSRLEGMAAQGRAVYVSEGCVYCHSQQVRGEGYGTDIARGWGDRRTVPRDYLYENPILLGSMRTGPDLANIGARQPDETWHLLHLYNPVITSPGSIMPPFDYLFEKRKIAGERAYDALALKNEWAPSAGFEIVPTDRAKALVAYLKAHTSFPVVVDPSHGTGRPELILPMSLAAIGAGADALIIEVHPRPKEALSDAHQALSFAQFEEIASKVKKVAAALGRDMETARDVD